MKHPAGREPHELTASQAADAIASGVLTSHDLVQSCLERIAARDEETRAIAHVDAEFALAQARQCDRRPSLGPLHGVPVAVKDMIDTADLPTEYNSPIYRGHRPARDAACVSILRSRGAVILGKVATVEFASLGDTPPTTNPNDCKRTPGGSSGGSAAAVGDLMVPVALGTQTGGSVIRPASFCGIYGFKPSYGLVSTEGIKVYAQSLDTIGWMARDARDLSLVAHALGVVETAVESRDSKGLTIGLFRTPHWMEADDASHQAVEQAAAQFAAAGCRIIEIGDVPEFEGLTEAQDRVMHWEGRGAYRAEYLSAHDRLHVNFRNEVENSLGRSAGDIRAAEDGIARARIAFESAFAGCDAWLTPAVPGEAPEGLESTGLATFNRMWTALHVPCVTIPGMAGPNGLPVGVQLVAPRLDDASLLGVCMGLGRIRPRGTNGS